MSLINRVALTVTRKQPYMDWANATDGPEPIVTYPADNPRSTYLVPDDGLEPDLGSAAASVPGLAPSLERRRSSVK